MFDDTCVQVNSNQEKWASGKKKSSVTEDVTADVQTRDASSREAGLKRPES